MGGVAIIGAGGFVGARTLEMAVLDGRRDIVPIVRAYRSVARSAHLGVPHRLGDASRPASLEASLAGCDVVVNVTMGDPTEVLRTTESVYESAVAAGARRLIHMSSATVYGGIERADLSDDAPPRPDHWMLYARQKGLAENYLRERMADGRMDIAVLRPGLIWGPGSPWVQGPATELAQGAAYLIGDGGGVCNLMYVDDLVRSIFAVVRHPAPAAGFYNVGDDGTTTWRDYYGALAAGLGLDLAGVHRIDAGPYRSTLRERLDSLKRTAPYKRLKTSLSQETRTALKLRMRRMRGRAATDSGSTSRPVVTRTMHDLQTTRHALPKHRFGATFGHQNQSSLAAGVAASVAWLRFIGVSDLLEEAAA
jgi:nucleoside-diphosphate-sugar epimerase